MVYLKKYMYSLFLIGLCLQSTYSIAAELPKLWDISIPGESDVADVVKGGGDLTRFISNAVAENPMLAAIPAAIVLGAALFVGGGKLYTYFAKKDTAQKEELALPSYKMMVKNYWAYNKWHAIVAVILVFAGKFTGYPIAGAFLGGGTIGWGYFMQRDAMLGVKIDVVGQKVDVANERLEKLQQGQENLGEELVNLSNQITGVEGQIKQQLKTLGSDMATNISDVASKVTGVSTQLTDLTGVVNNVASRVDQLAQTDAARTNELKMAMQSVSEKLESTKQTFGNMIKKIEETITRSQNEIKAENASIKTIFEGFALKTSTKLDAMSSQQTNLEQRVNDLLDTLKSYEDLSSSIQAQKDLIEQSIETMQQQLTAQSTGLLDQFHESQLKTDVSNKNMFESLAGKLKEFKESITGFVKNLLGTVEQRVSALENQTKEDRAHQEEVKQELGILKNMLLNLEKKLKEKEEMDRKKEEKEKKNRKKTKRFLKDLLQGQKCIMEGQERQEHIMGGAIETGSKMMQGLIGGPSQQEEHPVYFYSDNPPRALGGLMSIASFKNPMLRKPKKNKGIKGLLTFSQGKNREKIFPLLLPNDKEDDCKKE